MLSLSSTIISSTVVKKKQQAKIFIKIKWTISEAKVDDQTILKLKYC